MGKLCKPVSSNGFITVSSETDLIQTIKSSLGFNDDVETREFQIDIEPNVSGTIEILINDLFTIYLIAGDRWVENEEEIRSLVIKTANKQFRYIAKLQ